ncbi:MAG: lysozyme inhibitor LprI family protein [Clostridiales bacterium]|nr:lysozyme inhibitor LprI family protein [Clostridiales bacterium]
MKLKFWGLAGAAVMAAVCAVNVYASEETTASVMVTMDHSYENGESAVFTAADESGNVLWTYTSGTYEAAQLDVVNEIGADGNQYYFCEDGAIVALNLTTGEKVWENSDFDGSVTGYTFDGGGHLFVCGYLGPDLFIVSQEGETLYRVGQNSLGYYWPYQLTLGEDGYVNITYESGTENGDTLKVNVSSYVEIVPREEESAEAETADANVPAVLQETEAAAAELEAALQSGSLTQTEMNEYAFQLYTVWDDKLNELWQQLKNTLGEAEMSALTTEEIDWIYEKEAAMEAAAAPYEGGSMWTTEYYGTGADLTRERVYVLVSYLP